MKSYFDDLEFGEKKADDIFKETIGDELAMHDSDNDAKDETQTAPNLKTPEPKQISDKAKDKSNASFSVGDISCAKEEEKNSEESRSRK